MSAKIAGGTFFQSSPKNSGVPWKEAGGDIYSGVGQINP